MIRRLLIVVPASLIVLGACSWYWLLHTESGAHWIWTRAQSATDGALQAQQLKGDFGSGLVIRRLAFATDSTTLHIRELRLVVDLDLFPLQLQISEAVVNDAAIRISASDDVPRSSDLRSTIRNLALPLPLVLEDIRANNINVSGVIPENDIELSQIALAGSWHEKIVIDHFLVITSSPAEMSLRGSVAIVLESLSWDLQAQLTETIVDSGENDTEVRVTAAHVASNGTLNEYFLTAVATLDAPGFESLQLTTAGKGTTAGIEFSELGLRNTDVDLSGDGRITWGENWSLESRLNVATFNLHTLFDKWPASHPIRGDLSLLLDKNYLAISDSYLTETNTGMSVHANGKVDLLASVVEGDLRWDNVFWPLVGEQPAVSSKSGEISVDGSLDEWRIRGNVEVATATMPTGRFLIDGSGDRHHVETTIVDSAVFGGKVSGYATFNWRDQQQWSAGLDMSGINLSAFADDWPDDVDGRVDADGQTTPFLLDLRLSNIDAVFRGGPLSANGQVTLSDEHFVASGLKILHGETRIDLDGDPFARSGLKFDVAVSDLSQYVDEASGAFAAAGRLTLHPEQLSLRIDADSEAFSFRDIDVTGIEIIDRSDDDSVINAEIKAERLDIHGSVIENISVSLLADSSQQNLRLDASYGDADVHLLAVGKLDNLQHPSSWLGEVRELSFELEEEPLAKLSEPTPLSLSRNTIALDRGCITAAAGVRLCAQADWSADSYLNAGADLVDVPVNLVNRFIDTGLQFDQLLNGNFEWSRLKGSGTTGNAEITMSAGTIVDVDYTDIAITTDIGLLSFDVIEGQLLSGHAELSMPGFGHIEAQVSIPDFAQGTNSSVNGVLDLDLSDMAVLAAFSPLIDATNGEFRADLTLSGTLSEPLLVGDLAVINGSITYLPIGLRLDEINLTSLLHDDGQFELSGTFRAGEGRGEIVTRADYVTTVAKGFELQLRGNNMTLIDVPSITARADLDVRVGYDYEILSLDGHILIPHARVKPTNLAISRDTESEDVVIVAGELPDASGRQSREQETRIKGSIGLEFGDDVSIDLGPATANLTGNTVFSWKEDLIPIADGRYDLTGSIQAFGQVLEITEGGLRFPQVPANNPFVRIRAEREIYGNAQVKTAGVLMDGTLRQLAVEAYTRPQTTEERALTLLVTGSDFDFEQGLGAIDFGTYIAPRVFVSYGVGLFETENVIRIRYDLKRGFGITATSGEKETGLDLSYRIER